MKQCPHSIVETTTDCLVSVGRYKIDVEKLRRQRNAIPTLHRQR